GSLIFKRSEPIPMEGSSAEECFDQLKIPVILRIVNWCNGQIREPAIICQPHVDDLAGELIQSGRIVDQLLFDAQFQRTDKREDELLEAVVEILLDSSTRGVHAVQRHDARP